MSPVQVIRTQQINDLDSNGRPMHRMRVEWKTDHDGPFVDFFPVDGFDGTTVRNALEQRAREIARLRG